MQVGCAQLCVCVKVCAADRYCCTLGLCAAEQLPVCVCTGSAHVPGCTHGLGIPRDMALDTQLRASSCCPTWKTRQVCDVYVSAYVCHYWGLLARVTPSSLYTLCSHRKKNLSLCFPFITVKAKRGRLPVWKEREASLCPFSLRELSFPWSPRAGQSSTAKDPGWVQEEQAAVTKKLLLNPETSGEGW